MAERGRSSMRYRSAARALAALLLAAALLAFPVLKTAADGTRYIVKYKPDAGAPNAARTDVVNASELRRLKRADALEWYEPDGDALLLETGLTGSISPYYSGEQWNLDMIGAEAAYREGWTGEGVRVGVLDSGVNPHPDLADRLLPGRSFVEGAADPEDTSDNYGHGTRVAGLIAGDSDTGYIGAAPGAQLVPLKVTEGKSVKVSALCAAVYAAIDDFGCRVLNMSMGIRTDYTALREAMEYAEARGVVVVSAVGNGGTTAVYYPAAYDTVIGVSAVDDSGTVYYHANHNASVFLTAPGANVRSTAAPGGYTLSSGTSFAVPHVTGAAAVLLGADTDLTPKEVRAMLAETAGDCGPEGYDEAYGYGVLNLAGCVAVLTERANAPRPPCVFLPETGPAAAVRNDGNAALACVCLCAIYDADGICRAVETQRFTLSPGETAQLAPPEEGTRFGQFLCEAETLAPLAAARRS